MNLDFTVHREWRRSIPSRNRNNRWDGDDVEDWPANEDTAEAWVSGSMFEFDGCPFAWLLNETITPIFH